MNGEPLSAGARLPARTVVPGLYGDVSATKWVTELRLTTFEADPGYWVCRLVRPRPDLLASRIDIPTRSVLERRSR